MEQKSTDKTGQLLALIRGRQPMTLRQQLSLIVRLSVPAVMAQLSSIVMQYIDAAMVGSLGASASASIGLVSTTTWLFGGSCSAAAMGFSVQVAHAIGAKDMQRARDVFRQSLVAIAIFGLALGMAGVLISGALPVWLGGDESIREGATHYFVIYSAFLSSSTPAADATLSAVTMVWQYIGQMVFNMLVLTGLVRGSDRIVKEMFGL